MDAVCLTYDYEIYLGNNTGNIQKVLYENTEKILDILDARNCKATFFVDALFLDICEKQSPNDYQLLKTQIAKMYNNGHEIALHINPHWLFAKHNPQLRTWSWDNLDHYRLHRLSEDEIRQIFNTCIQAHRLILDDQNYNPQSFRAGGWCIQPFEQINSHLFKSNIFIDSSVIPGFFKNNLPIHYFDYRNLKRLHFWYFNNEVTEQFESGQFIEIPVSTIRLNPLMYIINYVLRKFENHTPFVRGPSAYARTSLIEKLKSFSRGDYVKLSTESISFYTLKYITKKMSGCGVAVAHPKSTSDQVVKNTNWLVQNFKCITLKQLRKYYE